MSENVLDAKMTLENSGFVAGMNKAREATARATDVMRTAVMGLTGLGAAFGAFRSVEGVIDGVMGAFERGRNLMDLSRQTTTNVRDLVVLQQAFRDSGASADSVGHTIFMLQKALGGVSEEGLPTAHIFQQLGLNMAQLKGMDTVAQFQAIAKSLSQLRDPSEQSAAAMQIFGRSASEVMGLLRDPDAFGNATKNVGGIGTMMQKNSAAFAQVSKSMELIKTNVDAAFAGIATGLAPALQQVSNAVNSIDFAGWGQKIGRAVAMLIEAFSSGKIFSLLRLGLTVAFEEAINVMYGGIFGLAGALQAEFAHVPQLLRDAFAMLTNPNFYKGIGELLLGAFMSIQGRLVQVMVTVADALGNRLADVLEHVPHYGKEMAAAMRADLAAGTTVMGNMTAAENAQGASMLSAGASDVRSASGNLVGDYLSTLRDEFRAFMGAFSANKAFDTSSAYKQIGDILVKLNQAIQPKSGGETTPAGGGDNGGHGLGRTEAYKAPEADRLAKIGLFVGNAPSAPGLAEAKRTAAATEKANVLLKMIEGHLLKTGWQPARYA